MKFREFSALFTGVLLLVVAWALWEAAGWEIQASLMAWLIGLPTAALLAAQLAREILGQPEKVIPVGGDEPGLLDPSLVERDTEALDPTEERRRTTLIICWILGFAAAIWLVGFQAGVGLATLLYLKSAGEKWTTVIGITLAVLIGVVLVFDCGMHIFFAEGKLFAWAGLRSGPVFTSFCYEVTAPFKG